MRRPRYAVSPFFYFPIIILIILSTNKVLEIGDLIFASTFQILSARQSATLFSSNIPGKPVSKHFNFWNQAFFQIS